MSSRLVKLYETKYFNWINIENTYVFILSLKTTENFENKNKKGEIWGWGKQKTTLVMSRAATLAKVFNQILLNNKLSWLVNVAGSGDYQPTDAAIAIKNEVIALIDIIQIFEYQLLLY